MIIQVRGTSGSGKSTVVRNVMKNVSRRLMREWKPQFAEKRRQPLYYILPGTNLIVLGHYETQCGGCDTIGSARQIHELVGELLGRCPNAVILCEGLLLSEDTKWTLRSKVPHYIIFLVTPLEECLKRIEARRAEKGNYKPLNPANTTNRVKVIEKARTKLTNGGIRCHRRSDRQAPRTILKILESQNVI